MNTARLGLSVILSVCFLAGGWSAPAAAEVDGYLPRPLPKTSYMETLERSGVPATLVGRLDRNGRRNLRRLVRAREDEAAGRALERLPQMTPEQFPAVALILNNPRRLKGADFAALTHALGDTADSIETARRRRPQP